MGSKSIQIIICMYLYPLSSQNKCPKLLPISFIKIKSKIIYKPYKINNFNKSIKPPKDSNLKWILSNKKDKNNSIKNKNLIN
jgi:hypothetical protein